MGLVHLNQINIQVLSLPNNIREPFFFWIISKTIDHQVPMVILVCFEARAQG